jgi:hypothetical protein
MILWDESSTSMHSHKSFANVWKMSCFVSTFTGGNQNTNPKVHPTISFLPTRFIVCTLVIVMNIVKLPLK